MDLSEKLRILSGAAKYDVSCSSSGSNRSTSNGSLGSTAQSGICHTFSADGRCISLLKILLTNYCIYDCLYCVNRKSNDIERAGFTVDEIVDLTMNFYRRNYIEGLFLSSAVFKSPNYTMEALIRVIKRLRLVEGFRGYIHIKAIPGSDEEYIKEAGLYADRMSVNLELPSNKSLLLLAPDKKKDDIINPMNLISKKIIVNNEERRLFKNAPQYAPAGQSTQMIVGASGDSDYTILNLTENLYSKFQLKRVYFSAYVPVNIGKNLPDLKSPPTLREHRLYQGDWLLRFYGFNAQELLSDKNPNFDINFDPKTNWALNNLQHFPLEINKVPYNMLLRIPGIGVRGAQKIMKSRRISKLTFEDLKRLGVVLKRAQYFITCNGRYHGSVPIDDLKIRKALMPAYDLNQIDSDWEQLTLFSSNQDKVLLLPDRNSAVIGEM